MEYHFHNWAIKTMTCVFLAKSNILASQVTHFDKASCHVGRTRMARIWGQSLANN